MLIAALQMHELSTFLSAAGVRKLVVSIDEEDDDARVVWER
jgi:hypothetical protein